MKNRKIFVGILITSLLLITWTVFSLARTTYKPQYYTCSACEHDFSENPQNDMGPVTVTTISSHEYQCSLCEGRVPYPHSWGNWISYHSSEHYSDCGGCVYCRGFESGERYRDCEGCIFREIK